MPQVLFIYNDPTAPEALLGDVFVEQGFDVDTFEVVPADQVDHPARHVTFPDPTRYDVVVPLGSRWSVYDEALRQTWVGAEMQLVRDAAVAGIGVLGVCFGGQLVAQALGGSVTQFVGTRARLVPDRQRHNDFDSAGSVVRMAFRPVDTAAGGRRDGPQRVCIAGVRLGPGAGFAVPPGTRRRAAGVWIAEDRSGDIPRLGLDADRLRARTAAERDFTVDRLRALVKGFLNRVARPVCQP